MKRLAIDLFCGLGGWTEGLLAEGYEVVGFDIERHEYGQHRYPARLVLQDVTTLHGSQFRDAALIVASPPCQAYSYRAMPWKKAKALPPPDNTLFESCFRIQREAVDAAGHFIPLVVENVCGAQKWVGRARWHYGSFYLWGDVPALMPEPRRAHKNPGFRFDGSGRSFQSEAVKVTTMGAGWYPPDHPKHVKGLSFNGHAERAVKVGDYGGNGRFPPGGLAQGAIDRGVKGIPHRTVGHWTNPAENGTQPNAPKQRNARKAASAMIAKIPLALSRHIAATYRQDAALSEPRK